MLPARQQRKQPKAVPLERLHIGRLLENLNNSTYCSLGVCAKLVSQSRVAQTRTRISVLFYIPQQLTASNLTQFKLQCRINVTCFTLCFQQGGWWGAPAGRSTAGAAAVTGDGQEGQDGQAEKRRSQPQPGVDPGEELRRQIRGRQSDRVSASSEILVPPPRSNHTSRDIGVSHFARFIARMHSTRIPIYESVWRGSLNG